MGKPTVVNGFGPRKPVYAMRAGARVTGAEPEDVVKELARIHETHGELTPAATVQEARKKSSPIHGCFEWDDATAAHEHRLAQARQLIRAVVVSYEDEPEAEPVSVYVHVPASADTGARYEPLQVVAQQPDLYALALAAMRERLAAAERAVSELVTAATMANKPQSASGARAVKKHLADAVEAAKQVA